MSTDSPQKPRDDRFRAGAVLTLVLAASFLVKLNQLSHAGIKALDESFHALVAKNLLKHPLTPTLIERPWLAHDYRDWQSNHIWLHKPIVPLWQMAASMALFGVNTLAMRLPSALLATAAVWLTYAIGRELLNGDRRAPLIAATLQAFHPAITSMVHGYVFSDHIDVAFLFWTELAMWCLVRTIATGSTRWAVATGVAQGVAFLCKTYPAFIVTGVAFVAWQLSSRAWVDAVASRLRGRHLAIILLATFLTAMPWMLSVAIRFPQEFAWEHKQIFHHLTRDVEQWAAPWDRLIFDFSLRIYGYFYPAILVATVLLIRAAWRERSLALWFLLAWGLGVLIPHTLATSKTMTATLIGWPPFLLLLGAMIVRAIEGDTRCLGGWLAATVLAIVAPGRIPQQGWGYPDTPGFAVIMRQNIWVLWHTLAALGIAEIAFRLLTPSPGTPGEGWGEGSREGRPTDEEPQPRRTLTLSSPGVPGEGTRLAAVFVASLATLYLGGRMALLAYRVTESRPEQRDRPSFVQLGPVINTTLPADAVILIENRQKLENVSAMFFIDRTVYAVTPETIQPAAQAVRNAGGVPFLASDRALPLPAMTDVLDGRRVYALPPVTPPP